MQHTGNGCGGGGPTAGTFQTPHLSKHWKDRDFLVMTLFLVEIHLIHNFSMACNTYIQCTYNNNLQDWNGSQVLRELSSI